MRKLVVLLLSALLFVGCETKKDTAATKKVTIAEAKIEKMGLTFAKPSNVTLTEQETSCNFVADKYKMVMMVGAGYAKPTLKEALADNSTNFWDDVKGEEIKNGYYLTYTQGKTYNVMSRIEVNGKTYFLSGTSNSTKDQTILTDMIKSIK